MDTPERTPSTRLTARLWELPPALVRQIAEDAIAAFLEYRDRYGRDEEAARAIAVAEVVEAAGVDLDALRAELAGELGADSTAEERPF